MWSSVVEDLVDRLVPDGGKGLLGKEKLCSECQGRGYTRKNQGGGLAMRDAAGFPLGQSPRWTAGRFP